MCSAVYEDGLGVSTNPSRNRVEYLLTCGIAPAEAVDVFIKLNLSEMLILDSSNPRLLAYQPHRRRDVHIAKKDCASDHLCRGQARHRQTVPHGCHTPLRPYLKGWVG